MVFGSLWHSQLNIMAFPQKTALWQMVRGELQPLSYGAKPGEAVGPKKGLEERGVWGMVTWGEKNERITADKVEWYPHPHEISLWWCCCDVTAITFSLLLDLKILPSKTSPVVSIYSIFAFFSNPTNTIYLRLPRHGPGSPWVKVLFVVKL